MSARQHLDGILTLLTGEGTPFTTGEIEARGQTYTGYTAAPAHVRDLWLGSKAEDDHLFLVYEDERMTYGDARQRILELANGMITDFGVAPGDSVGIAMRNYPEWVLAWWAVQMAGATAVEMNSFWNSTELCYGVTDSGSAVLFCDRDRHDALVEQLDSITDAGVDLKMIVVRDDDPDSLHERATEFGDVSGPTSVPELGVGPDDRSAIVYTSGTTAFPKGVVHSQRNVITNVTSMGLLTVAYRMAELAAAGEDPMGAVADSGQAIMLVAVPLFHVTGSHCVMLPISVAGGALVLMYKWDAAKALELIEREKVTNFTGVPTMTMDMLAHPDFGSRDVSSMKSMGSGGAPNPPHMVAKVNDSMPTAQAGQGYGLSEVSGIATLTGGLFYADKPASAGLQPPISEMKVIDEEGNSLPTGERGELLIRGPHVFCEYHNKPEATAEAVDPEGWFHSGDIAIIDDEGFVFIVDRAKDVVIRGGENVGSAEVEAAIAEHPAVHECAVFGVPHERLGEEVAVAVTPIDGETIDIEELRAFAAERLSAFKVPAHVFVHDEPLPKNPNGKVLKRTLRELAEGDA